MMPAIGIDGVLVVRNSPLRSLSFAVESNCSTSIEQTAPFTYTCPWHKVFPAGAQTRCTCMAFGRCWGRTKYEEAGLIATSRFRGSRAGTLRPSHLNELPRGLRGGRGVNPRSIARRFDSHRLRGLLTDVERRFRVDSRFKPANVRRWAGGQQRKAVFLFSFE